MVDVVVWHPFSLSPVPLHIWVQYLFSECVHLPNGAWILFLNDETRDDCACTGTGKLAHSSLLKVSEKVQAHVVLTVGHRN